MISVASDCRVHRISGTLSFSSSSFFSSSLSSENEWHPGWEKHCDEFPSLPEFPLSRFRAVRRRWWVLCRKGFKWSWLGLQGTSRVNVILFVMIIVLGWRGTCVPMSSFYWCSKDLFFFYNFSLHVLISVGRPLRLGWAGLWEALKWGLSSS